MFCNKCGSFIGDQDKFCHYCGAEIIPPEPVQPSEPKKKNTGLLVGIIIAGGVVLLVVLLVLVTYFRRQASDSLRKWQNKYESEYDRDDDWMPDFFEEDGQENDFF